MCPWREAWTSRTFPCHAISSSVYLRTCWDTQSNLSGTVALQGREAFNGLQDVQIIQMLIRYTFLLFVNSLKDHRRFPGKSIENNLFSIWACFKSHHLADSLSLLTIFVSKGKQWWWKSVGPFWAIEILFILSHWKIVVRNSCLAQRRSLLRQIALSRS